MPESRTACPSPQHLAAYGLGKLSAAELSSVHHHLLCCAECRRKVESLPPDSFVGQLQAASPKGETVQPTPVRPASVAVDANTILPTHTPLAPQPADVPSELAGHPKFLILRELGRGGMGVVYQARHKEMERQVVIKVINRALLDRQDSLERFRREICAAAQLSHPNIVTAYDAEQAGDAHMLVMEFVPGQSLAEVLKKHGPLPVAHACHYMRQVALGLQHAFEHNLVHRDIKPQNLMLTPKGQVKILDFGLAKLLREEGSGMELTASGAYMGTPDYCAPEQATDARTADIRADLYSLGCTLYCLVSGRPPFREDTVVKTILAHLEKQPQPLPDLRPDVPAELWQVVARLLAKQPEKRYQKPIEVAQALAPFIKPGANPDAKGRPAQPQDTALPGKGTEIGADTGKIKKVLRDALLPTPPKNMPVREEASPFADLTDEGAPSKKVRPAREEAKSSLAAWWKHPRVLVAAGCASVALILLAAIIILIRTSDGTIVLENLPPDAVVTVDGGTVTVTAASGNTFEVGVAARKKHRLEVKQDGFKVFAKEVEIDAGGRETVRVRLEPKRGFPDNPAVQPEPAPMVSEDAKEITNGIGMKLVRIKAGKFWMGSTKEEQDETIADYEKITGKKVGDWAVALCRSEGPRHQVEITKDFYMGFHEVTQAQYPKVMGKNPSYFCADGGGKDQVKGINTDDFPVENVSYEDAVEFCKNLSEMAAEKRARRKYRLPTEAEWEYSCRAGAASRHFHFGNSLSSKQANFNGDLPFGGAAKGDFLGRARQVGQYKANDFGLFDMHGNVAEWCSDWYGDDDYGKRPPRDPQGPSFSPSSTRVYRGGGWRSSGAECRSAWRPSFRPDDRRPFLGFRAAQVPSE
jgi:serine/threonine protein kinase/formylglycine-generating enzyme required for sulfatase activity